MSSYETVPDFTTSKIQETSSIESELFLLLKSHIDFQCNLLNQLNQSRIRSFERFRKYCQTLTSSYSSESFKFDQEQFQNEYKRYDRNYRHWRKRIQKIRKQTKLSSNIYDILYELFAKIESFERYKLDDQQISTNNITKDEDEILDVSPNKDIECNFHCFVDGCGEIFLLKTNFLNHLFEHSIDVSQNATTSKTKQSTKRTARRTRIQTTPKKSITNTNIKKPTNVTNDNAKSPLLKKLPKAPTAIVPTVKKPRNNKLPKSRLRNSKKSKRKKNDDPIVLSCDFEGCTYVGKNLSILKSHKVSHGDIRPYKCDQCGLAFKYKGQLKTHQIGVHERKRHECPFEGCPINFATAFSVRQHIEIVHTIDPPKFHCPVEGCNYSNVRKDFLRKHSKIHSEERPYKCLWPGCGKAFKWYINLRDHLLMHKNERQFKCKWSDCSYACNTNNNLLKHHAIHEKKEKTSKRIQQLETPKGNLESLETGQIPEQPQYCSIPWDTRMEVSMQFSNLQ